MITGKIREEITTPKDYGLNHDIWNYGQHEAIEEIKDNGKLFTFLDAPTGSGKSGIIAALTNGLKHEEIKRTMVLTNTKALQLTNYRDSYGYIPLMGIDNYPCELNHFENGASLCEYRNNMRECPSAIDCEYQKMSYRVRNSYRACLNYHMYASAGWVWDTKFDYLVLDEAHLLSGIVRSFNSLTIKAITRDRYSLALPPEDIRDLPKWLNELLKGIRKEVEALEKSINIQKDIGEIKELNKLKNDLRKINFVLSSISESKENFEEWHFIQADKKGSTIVKPLTAKYHFKKVFNTLGVNKIILMSATMPKNIKNELGIDEDNSQDVVIPQTLKRNVYYSSSFPKMTKDRIKYLKRRNINAYDVQARLVSRNFHSSSNWKRNEWSGLIFSNSKDKALFLQQAYKEYIGNRAILMRDNMGTDQHIPWWNKQKKKVSNAILSTWALQEGVNLPNDKIVIIGVTPYGYIGDSYGRAFSNNNKDEYKSEAAQKIIQGIGRIYRRPDHYKPGEKIAIIADSGFIALKKYFPKHFQDSLTKL